MLTASVTARRGTGARCGVLVEERNNLWIWLPGVIGMNLLTLILTGVIPYTHRLSRS